MKSIFLLAVALSHVLTPGVLALDPATQQPLTVDVICNTNWGKDARHVTESMRRQVFKRYGIAWQWRRLFEVDHLISRDIGGADDVRNLWPQPLSIAKRVKDPIEVEIRKRICGTSKSGIRVDLRVAQERMRADWPTTLK